MLQRIQSIFLTLAAGLIAASYFLPFGHVNGTVLRSYGAKVDGVYLDTVCSYWFHIPLFLACVLSLWALFSYSNRARQMAIVRSTFILFATAYGLLAFYIMDAQTVLQGTYAVGISVALPFAAMLCNWLALRAIRKDDQLIKSVDRIR
jgi:ABC-type dipeptide/oligopeptide/nickel transport system permease subunit